MDPRLLSISAMLGLSSSAGLNTTLPLLAIGAADAAGLLHLTPPYDALGSPVALGGLLLLAVVEFLWDKVPGLDHVLHAIQLPASMAAGALLAGTQAGAINAVHPGIVILAGLLLAGTVHSARLAVRHIVTFGPAKLLTPIVSTAEDVGALALLGSAAAAPQFSPVILGGMFLIWLGFLILAAVLFGKLARAGWRALRSSLGWESSPVLLPSPLLSRGPSLLLRLLARLRQLFGGGPKWPDEPDGGSPPAYLRYIPGGPRAGEGRGG